MHLHAPTQSPTAERSDDTQSPFADFRDRVRDELLSIVDDAEEHERKHREFDTWVREVRIPATYNSEGPRRIESGSCSMEYAVAPLRDGRFGGRCDCRTGNETGSHGWKAYPSREEALADILTYAHRAFDRNKLQGSVSKGEKASSFQMLARLESGTLFGFEEPHPLPRSEWYDDMIAAEVDSMVLWQGFELIDVVRWMKNAPGKSGSFFDIPLPAGAKEEGCFIGSDENEDDGDDDDGDPDDKD